MRMPLKSLYADHQGKVTDKWSLYLEIYDDLLAPYRNLPVHLLEIGIQNGGSMEIWTRYFETGIRFVGCDINPKCSDLVYEDPRIQVLIGDANSKDIAEKIHSNFGHFDIIIDDGSHTSPDIIRTFFNYFQQLKIGGIFIFEDLHCSYWQEYEGGLNYPLSSISFFKALADVLNEEHWGNQKNARDLLKPFIDHYAIPISTIDFSQILSVTFFNSMCVIRKTHANGGRLGKRVTAGNQEFVVEGLLKLEGTSAPALDQKNNPWAQLHLVNIGYEGQPLPAAFARYSGELSASALNNHPDRSAHIVPMMTHGQDSLQALASEQARKIESLTLEVHRLKAANQINYTASEAIRNAKSWRFLKRAMVLWDQCNKLFSKLNFRRIPPQATSPDLQASSTGETGDLLPAQTEVVITSEGTTKRN
jgi:SAM-dependent methyltransferase